MWLLRSAWVISYRRTCVTLAIAIVSSTLPLINGSQGKIKRARPFYKDQFKALRKVVSPEVRQRKLRECSMFPELIYPFQEVSHLKITMCAPEWYHVHHGPYAFDKGVYSMDGQSHLRKTCLSLLLLTACSEEYFANIAVAYRAEIRELYELGCRMNNIIVRDIHGAHQAPF